MASVSEHARAGDRSLVVLRLILLLALLYGCGLAVVAVSSSPPGEELRTVISAAGVLAIDVVLLWTAKDIVVRQTKDRRWSRAIPFGLVSCALLAIGPSSAEILIAVSFTPVGVCVLVEDLRGAAWAIALCSVGLGVAALQPHGPSSLGPAVSDVIPALAVMAGGLLPVRYAKRTVEGAGAEVARIRELVAGSPITLSELAELREKDKREENRSRIDAELAAGADVEALVKKGYPRKTVNGRVRWREELLAVRSFLARGHTDAEIGRKLELAARKIRYRREAIEAELGVSSREQAIAMLRNEARRQEDDEWLP
jgi:DNA-binding NarL/FixJ family response regulator